MDVGVWLRNLGLGQYEATFRDNEIDGAVLPNLTVDDLKDLGVAVVGHRRKIMSAIEELNAESAAPAEAAHAPAAQIPVPADAAERRQLTVMFSDLVGSTALSARLDPEDMRQVIRAYQDACSGVVARYDGFIAKFMGDGVLAYFGFPRAHEDDAARAVHAGLEIAEAVAALQTRAGENLAVRVGIATGLVVVGDLVGQGSAQEQAVVGDTPNLAARLQGLAEAGGVVVSAATRRLIGDRFRLKDLGRHAVKGLAEPVEAYAALGVSQSESRFEAAHAARLAGFVGRETESADLLACQRRAWSGQGEIVLISGDAGIGKSRLAAWLAEQVAETPHTRLRYQCSPYHRDSALYPFVQQLERAAGIGPQEPAQTKLDKLEKVLGLATDRMGEVAPLIASMLSIPTGARYPALNLSPAQQRRQTLSALLDQMEGLAKKQPVLVLFEDAHWADATSLEVLDLAIERVRHLPVLFLITFRPEFEAPWNGLPDVETIALGRLDRAEAERLVESVTGGRKLPGDVLALVVAKTDGVPLFVEELTKNVLESGLLVEEADGFRLDGPLPPLAIPSTLQDSLMARLDRLAAVKEIAQIGAAIGREFSYPLLNAVVDRDEATLRAALAQLEESELVFRSGEPPAARYTFKHALVQDAAYESLLKSRRQILHQKIAQTLRERFADVVEAEPELLAHHFTQAGLTAPAIEYWGKAGDLALRRSAFKEAIAHLGKAIEMTEALAGTGDKEPASARVKLHALHGSAHLHAAGPGAAQTTAAFSRARELAGANDDAPERLSPYYGLWVSHYVRGEFTQAREVTDSMLRDFESQPGSQDYSLIHRLIGMNCHAAGEYVDARRHVEESVASYNSGRDRGSALRFGVDTGVAARCLLAIVVWPLGDFDAARTISQEAIALAQQLDHVPSLAFANGLVAVLDATRSDSAATLLRADVAYDLACEHGMQLYRAFGTFFRGWALSHTSDQEVGLAEMRRGADLLKMQGRGVWWLVATLMAEAEVELGSVDEALATIDGVLNEARRAGWVASASTAHKLRGEILLKQNPANPASAEEAFLTAIAIAQAQKARSFELRAALALAKLYRATGRDADAHAVLGPALEGFSTTPEFPEIAEARTLVEALAQTDEVKTATAARQRRIRLQISYGNAMFAARGFAAPETAAAFDRARELAGGDADLAERYSITYGLWAGNYVRGELGAMRELSEAFLCDCANRPDSPEAGVAHRIYGVTKSFAGEFGEARVHLEKALAIFEREQDHELAFRFGMDTGVAAMIQAAMVYWPLGEFDLARRQADAMATRLACVRHVATAAYAHTFYAMFEIMRRDRNRAALGASALLNLAQEHEMPQWNAFAKFLECWTESRTGDASAGIMGMRNAIALLHEQKIALFGPLIKSVLAEAEAETGQNAAALATLDQALAESDRSGQRRYDSELHRARGEILRRQNVADLGPAEDAFGAAIEIAQAQKARSFGLRAALSLAKLYRSTDRPADAHAVLGPALAGFSRTPEMPEIAEALALVTALEAGAHL